MQPISLARQWAKQAPGYNARVLVHQWGRRGSRTSEYFAALGKVAKSRLEIAVNRNGINRPTFYTNGVCQCCGGVETAPVLKFVWGIDPAAGKFGEYKASRVRFAIHTHAWVIACPDCVEVFDLVELPRPDMTLTSDGRAIHARRHPILARFDDPPWFVEIDTRGTSPEVKPIKSEDLPWIFKRTRSGDELRFEP